MTIVPDLHAKLLGETIPGELIRFRFWRKMVLGMVAGCDFLQIPSGMVIVALEDLPDRPGSAGGFLPMVEHLMTETALSFGTAHMVVVHPAASAASDADEQFNTNGVLLVGGDARAIRSRSAKDDYSDHTLIIDVDSWKAIRTALPHPRRWRVAVLNWELRLLTHVPIHPPLPPVFTFAARS
jgi:hypothetical protein